MQGNLLIDTKGNNQPCYNIHKWEQKTDETTELVQNINIM